jgi:hypothetical protein
MMLLSIGPPDSQALEFAAERVIRTDQRTQRTQVFYRDDMWRLEHQGPGPVNVTIVRKDRNLVWHVLPALQRFTTVLFNPDYRLLVTAHLSGELSRHIIGTQLLDGHPTTLYEVTVSSPDVVHPEVYYQWVATDINFPLKIVKKNGAWILEYHHMRIGQVSDSLFQLPHRYQPVNP